MDVQASALGAEHSLERLGLIYLPTDKYHFYQMVTYLQVLMPKLDINRSIHLLAQRVVTLGGISLLLCWYWPMYNFSIATEESWLPGLFMTLSGPTKGHICIILYYLICISGQHHIYIHYLDYEWYIYSHLRSLFRKYSSSNCIGGCYSAFQCWWTYTFTFHIWEGCCFSVMKFSTSDPWVITQILVKQVSKTPGNV